MHDPISRGLASLECITHISKKRPLGRAEVEMCPVKNVGEGEVTRVADSSGRAWDKRSESAIDESQGGLR
jgi:hypothetical protein